MTTQPLTHTGSSPLPDTTIDVWLLTQRDCAFCEHAKAVLGRLSHDHPLAVTEITLESVEGQALALQHGVMFAPGVFINGTLASYGRPSERRIRRILTQRQFPSTDVKVNSCHHPEPSGPATPPIPGIGPASNGTLPVTGRDVTSRPVNQPPRKANR